MKHNMPPAPKTGPNGEVLIRTTVTQKSETRLVYEYSRTPIRQEMGPEEITLEAKSTDRTFLAKRNGEWVWTDW